MSKKYRDNSDESSVSFGNYQLITDDFHSRDSCLTNSNDSLQTVGIAFTTGGSEDPSLYENKGRLH